MMGPMSVLGWTEHRDSCLYYLLWKGSYMDLDSVCTLDDSIQSRQVDLRYTFTSQTR